MANKSVILNHLGTYLLSGALSLGAVSGITNYAYAKDNPKKSDKQKTTALIYGERELTATGDGTLAKSYINDIDVSNDYSLKSRFSSTKGKITYSVIDAKKGLEKIIKNIKAKTSKEKAFKHYLINLAKTLKTNDKASLKLLNNAIKDGIISPGKDNLYNEENGWKIKDDVYMAIVKTNKQSVPVLLHFNTKSYEENILEETRDAEDREIIGRRRKENKLEQKARKIEKDSLKVIPDTTYHKFDEEQSLNKNSISVIPKKELSTSLGLETGYGTNKESVVGAFIDIPITSWLSVEGFGNWYVTNRNPISSNISTEITSRQKELGSAKNTYKYRTDEIKTTSEQKAIADIGAGLTFKFNDYLETPLRIGVNIANEQKMLEGKSTISFERNNLPIGLPETITNTKDGGKDLKTNLYLSAGARANLTNRLSVGASFDRIGKTNSGRINVRYNFLR